MKTIKVDELDGLIGQSLGMSDWVNMQQDRVTQFADVTEDHQFIHTDPERAKLTPFGGPIAHGFLTLSLLSKFAEQAALLIEGADIVINYGCDGVRFLAPVKVGKRIRGHFDLKAVDEKRPGQFLLTYRVSVEIEGEDKPALVADLLNMQLLK